MPLRLLVACAIDRGLVLPTILLYRAQGKEEMDSAANSPRTSTLRRVQQIIQPVPTTSSRPTRTLDNLHSSVSNSGLRRSEPEQKVKKIAGADPHVARTSTPQVSRDHVSLVRVDEEADPDPRPPQTDSPPIHHWMLQLLTVPYLERTRWNRSRI